MKESMNSNDGQAHDKKQIIILRQKIYYHKGKISLQNNDMKDAIKFFEKSLEYGNFYYNKLKIKCLKMISFILSKYQQFDKESEQIYFMAQFFRKDKRDIYFLLDSTQKLSENVQLISQVIRGLFNDQFKEQDSLKIDRFESNVENLLPFSTKNELLEKDYNQIFDSFTEKLKQYLFKEQENSKGKYRCVFYACNNAIQQLNILSRKGRAKYLIVFVYGDNNISYSAQINEQHEEINDENKEQYWPELIDSLQNSYIHFVNYLYQNIYNLMQVLVGYNLRKQPVKGNKFLRLCTLSKRFLIIDLASKNNNNNSQEILKEFNNFFN